MYGRWCSEKWDGQKLSEKPLFYQGVDDFTEGILLGLSDEVQAVCRKVESLVSGFDLKDACTLHQWYLDSYKGQMADDSTLKLSMNTNSAYTGLTHPMKEVDGGFMPDLKYRYLAEDVPTGLCFTRGLAEFLGQIGFMLCKARDKQGVEHGRLMCLEFGIQGSSKSPPLLWTRQAR